MQTPSGLRKHSCHEQDWEGREFTRAAKHRRENRL